MDFGQYLPVIEDRIRKAKSREEIEAIITEAGQTLRTSNTSPYWVRDFWRRLRASLDVALKEADHQDDHEYMEYADELLGQLLAQTSGS